MSDHREVIATASILFFLNSNRGSFFTATEIAGMTQGLHPDTDEVELRSIANVLANFGFIRGRELQGDMEFAFNSFPGSMAEAKALTDSVQEIRKLDLQKTSKIMASNMEAIGASSRMEAGGIARLEKLNDQANDGNADLSDLIDPDLREKVKNQLRESLNNSGSEFEIEMADPKADPEASQDAYAGEVADYIILEYLEGRSDVGNMQIMGAVASYIDDTLKNHPDFFRPKASAPAPESKLNQEERFTLKVREALAEMMKGRKIEWANDHEKELSDIAAHLVEEKFQGRFHISKLDLNMELRDYLDSATRLYPDTFKWLPIREEAPVELKAPISKTFDLLKSELQGFITARSGAHITSDGLSCPHCGAEEVYKDAREPENQDKWIFVIRAFRVDNSSECRNCDKWFQV